MNERIWYWLVVSKINREAVLSIKDGPILIFCTKEIAEKHAISTNLPAMDFVKMDKAELTKKFGEDCYVILDPSRRLNTEEAVPIWYLQENFQ